MKTSVYLADLRHDYGGVLATDCMPVGVGYMKAVMDRDLPEVASRVFAYPNILLDAMKEQPPDVLMVSNYVWNEAIGLHFAKIAKRINPDTLVVMGGPNIEVEPERQIEFVRRQPNIDMYVLGEGDFLATDVVRRFIEVDKSVAAFGDLEHESSVWRRSNGEYAHAEMRKRHKGVEEIPSPWLTGIMDEFFDGKMSPIIETNRGCPFSCSFCVQGTTYYSKINDFSLERMEAEIDYIGALIQSKSPNVGTLRIADANYGMYERDVTISEHIGLAQKKYGWPTFIDATTGKNRADRIIRSMEKVNGALVLYQAVQSLDDTVLRNVRRKNISIQAYEQIRVHVRGRGLKINSDLILALPGDNLVAHREGMKKLLNAGTDQMHCFQAMMLKGSDMESQESRDEFKVDTRFRVLPKNYGEYGGERVFDIEEIIVANDTLPFEDYIRARELHMAFSIFWNDGWFSDVISFAASCGIEAFDWMEAMLEAMRADTGKMRALLDEFVRETNGELFATREACAEFYGQDENFEKLRRGEIGDNLMYKYRAAASFLLWPELCELAMGETRTMLVAAGVDETIANFDEFWSDFHGFVRGKHAHGATEEAVLTPESATMRYDMAMWVSEGMPKDTRAHRLASAEPFEFRLALEDERELAAAFKVWSSELKGLSKLVTRIRVGSQERECHPLNGRKLASGLRNGNGTAAVRSEQQTAGADAGDGQDG